MHCIDTQAIYVRQRHSFTRVYIYTVYNHIQLNVCISTGYLENIN